MIRDNRGNWIIGFQKFLGKGSSILAELWGAFLGLKLAISINATRVILESDCTTIIKMLKDDQDYSLHHFASMISDCRSYLNHFEDITITHVMREGNRSADALAGNALATTSDYVLLQLCPPSASAAFNADFFGISTPRGIG